MAKEKNKNASNIDYEKIKFYKRVLSKCIAIIATVCFFGSLYIADLFFVMFFCIITIFIINI